MRLSTIAHSDKRQRGRARRAGLALIGIVAFVGAGQVAKGAEAPVAGPVAAEVLRTIDGDTLEVRARLWPGLEMTTKVRIRGIDTPEIRGHCPREKEMARAAHRRLDALIGSGGVRLSNIAGGKYYGRVVADVATADGRPVGPLMLESGLARPYDGGARGDWCGLARLGD